MKDKRAKIYLAAIALVCCLIFTVSGLVYNQQLVYRQKENTREFVATYCDLLRQRMISEFNYTAPFTYYLLVDPNATIENLPVYQKIMAHEEVLDIQIRRKWELELTKIEGKEHLQERNYPYRLATLREEFIVYGPIWMDEYETDVLVSVLPLYNDKGEFVCCTAVILDAAKIVNTFQLKTLKEKFRLDYQLWTVSGETGHKIVLSESGKDTEYIDMVEGTFEMPAKWYLMVKPHEGWGVSVVPFVLSGLLIGVMLATLAGFFMELKWAKGEMKRLCSVDHETQFLNQKGFIEYIRASKPVKTVFIVKLYPYHRIFNMLTLEQRKAWIEDVRRTLSEYKQSDTVVARLQDDMFALAFNGHFDDRQCRGIQREMEVELIRSFMFDEQRISLYPVIRCFYYSKWGRFTKALEKVQKDMYDDIRALPSFDGGDEEP